MNFTISRNDFYRVLQKVINVVPSKSTVDILYSVLVIVEENQLKIIATDLEITQIAWASCSVSETGSVVVPAISETMATSCSVSELISELLPVFRLPKIPICGFASLPFIAMQL